MNALTRALTGRRTAWIVVLVGLVLGMGVTFGLGEAERDPSPTDSLPAGYDSTLGVELQQSLPEDDESAAIVLFSAEEDIEQHLGDIEQLFASTVESVGTGGGEGQPGGGEGQPGGPPGALQP